MGGPLHSFFFFVLWKISAMYGNLPPMFWLLYLRRRFSSYGRKSSVKQKMEVMGSVG